MFHREDRRKENVPMSRNLRFVAMIVSPVRWHVANSVWGGSIFGVCDLRR